MAVSAISAVSRKAASVLRKNDRQLHGRPSAVAGGLCVGCTAKLVYAEPHAGLARVSAAAFGAADVAARPLAVCQERLCLWLALSLYHAGVVVGLLSDAIFAGRYSAALWRGQPASAGGFGGAFSLSAGFVAARPHPHDERAGGRRVEERLADPDGVHACRPVLHGQRLRASRRGLARAAGARDDLSRRIAELLDAVPHDTPGGTASAPARRPR